MWGVSSTGSVRYEDVKKVRIRYIQYKGERLT
jgi:hypothetical protein